MSAAPHFYGWMLSNPLSSQHSTLRTRKLSEERLMAFGQPGFANPSGRSSAGTSVFMGSLWPTR